MHIRTYCCMWTETASVLSYFHTARLSLLYAACRYVANADRLGAVVMESRNRADSLDDEDDETFGFT